MSYGKVNYRLFTLTAIAGFILLPTEGTASLHHRSITTRVVGGHPTSIMDYPFMISLQKKTFGHICGGTYLRDKHVLSAAHCFVTTHEEGNHRVQNPLLFIAIAGVTDVTSLSVQNMQIRLISQIDVHPRYNRTSRFNDIALIRLDKSFTTVPEVSPISLPSRNYIFNDIPLPISDSESTTFCLILGWGYLREGLPLGHGESLMVAKVPLLKNTNCSNWYSENGRFYFSEDLQICAGFQEGDIDACQGDSGGPLICNGVQIGIVSTGEGCGRRERAGIYTRVDIYMNWIDKIVHLNDRSVSSIIIINFCLVAYSFVFCIFISSMLSAVCLPY